MDDKERLSNTLGIQIDLEQEYRLTRWLKHLLYICGMPFGKDGVRVSLQEALSILQGSDDQHQELLRRIEPSLPADIRADFEKLHKASLQHRVRATESVINCVRELLNMKAD